MSVTIDEATADLIARSLAEDLGAGDVTSNTTVPDGARARARIVQKGEGVLFGLDVAAEALRQSGAGELDKLTVEGLWRSAVPAEVAFISGDARGILAGERVALNFLGHLSGVATLTARYVEAIRAAGGDATLLDTRKTTPGLRALEKQAVLAGGGQNHRRGLDDAVLIKENHIALAGGLEVAVERGRESGLPVEVECRDEGEVSAALASGAERLLLDNMTSDVLRACVAIRDEAGSAAELEASGGVTLENVGEIAATGVDFVSVGALTHSAPTARRLDAARAGIGRRPRNRADFRGDTPLKSALFLLQQPRQPAVRQHLAAGLLGGAVTGDPIAVVDRGDRLAAARAGLALAAVDLERHRHLVGDGVADDLLVVLDRLAEDGQRGVDLPDLAGGEIGTLLERTQPRLPENLVDPGTADPGDRPLIAEQGVQVPRLVEQLRELLDRRRRPGLGPERGDHLMARDLAGGQQSGPGPLFGPELPQAQLLSFTEPDQDPRRLVAERCALVEQLQPPGGHHVDEQRQRRAVALELDDRHLPDPPDLGHRHPRERVERRVERLHRDHPRRQRRLDRETARGRVQASRGDLDFRQLGHRTRLEPNGPPR